jgi:hypothetical protein
MYIPLRERMAVILPIEVEVPPKLLYWCWGTNYTDMSVSVALHGRSLRDIVIQQEHTESDSLDKHLITWTISTNVLNMI